MPEICQPSMTEWSQALLEMYLLTLGSS